MAKQCCRVDRECSEDECVMWDKHESQCTEVVLMRRMIVFDKNRIAEEKRKRRISGDMADFT